MTKKELIKRISEYPDHMEIVLAPRTSDFAYGALEKVEMKNIPFMEEEGGEPIAYDDVIVLSED